MFAVGYCAPVCVCSQCARSLLLCVFLAVVFVIYSFNFSIHSIFNSTWTAPQCITTTTTTMTVIIADSSYTLWLLYKLLFVPCFVLLARLFLVLMPRRKFAVSFADNNNGNVNGNVNGPMNGGGNGRKSSVSESANPNELPKPKRVLFQRENLRIGWKQSERKWQVGTGMLNVGNTCYLNSTLQALFHIPAMANWLVSEQAHLENCNISESCGGSGCIICAMAKTLQSTQSNQSAVRPFLIYTKLRQICKHMVVGRQEDAHEFLRFLVEAMEKAYLMRFRNYKEMDQLTKETTPLGQIFGGYLRSEVRCLSCNHVSITFQHFQDMLLDIRKADTLEEAFDGYFSRERLEDMGYKCEGCKKKVSGRRRREIYRYINNIV